MNECSIDDKQTGSNFPHTGLPHTELWQSPYMRALIQEQGTGNMFTSRHFLKGSTHHVLEHGTNVTLHVSVLQPGDITIQPLVNTLVFTTL